MSEPTPIPENDEETVHGLDVESGPVATEPDAPVDGVIPEDEFGIEIRTLASEMKKSYLEYAMAVIVGRALPDARDGLKPVQRRALYTMHEDGNHYNRAYQKSANIVGSTMGRRHPHGDTAIYDTMVRMAQDWQLRLPFIDGQGNWGCFTGDTELYINDEDVIMTMRKIDFKSLCSEYQDRPFYVATTRSDGTTGLVKGRAPRLTKQDAALVEVVIEIDGSTEHIRCTPDHKFMVDGEGAPEYVEAHLLQPGTKLRTVHENWPIRCRVAEYISYVGSAPAEAGLVRSVTPLEEREDVYDITVDEHHNFLLTAGVFVHNSRDGDSAAAYRYSEARMTSAAAQMLRDKIGRAHV